jgi:hypothetical protein
MDMGNLVTSKKASCTLVHGVIAVSCNKDLETLVNKISNEWACYGSYIKLKELQAVETVNPYQIYFVYLLTHRQTLVDEKGDILKAAQVKMHQEDYFVSQDLPLHWGFCPLPLCNLHINISWIPKHSKTVNMAKLPNNIQTCRKVLHLEVDKK